MSQPPSNPEERPHLVLQPLRAHGRSKFTGHRSGKQLRNRRRIVTTSVAIIAAAVIAASFSFYNKSADATGPSGPLPVQLPTTSQSYLGVYVNGVPSSYDGVTAFTHATGARPDVVMYYSGWFEQFPVRFARTVANNGAVPLVQINPDGRGISITGIANGRYDGYLSAYAEAVRAYRHPEFRPRNERTVVFLGLREHIPGGFRGRLATHRYAVPCPGRPERYLAVDGQRH